MNKKRTIILTILLTATTTLFGCNSTTTSTKSSINSSTSTSDSNTDDIEFEVNSNTEDIDIDIDTNIDTTETSTNTINNDNNSVKTKPTNTTSTQKETSKITQTNTTKQNTSSKAENITTIKNDPTTYKSKSGYSLNFPGSWNNKYTVEENGDSLTVIFKSVDSDKINYVPWMLTVKKFNSSDDYYYIRDFKHFNVGNDEYIAYGPDSVTLNDDVKDYDKYLQMSSNEVENIAKSIVVNQ